MLRAVLENDFHQDMLQHGLDVAHEWVLTHPEQMREVTEKLFKELGVGKLAKGFHWIGIDMQQRTIDSLLEKVEAMADPEHPWRQHVETYGHNLMRALADTNSSASIRLNATKNALLESPQMLNFISGAVVILCQAIKQDLQKTHSGIAMNVRAAIELLGQNLMENSEVRQLLNQRLSSAAIQLSDQYSDKVIRFISQRIHEWDSTEMIAKIENEVGGDLHMIRVNGVVVGACIGLILGVIRASIEVLL